MPPDPARTAPRRLTPAEFGRGIGVSASTVKRLVDGGELPAERTRGNHRRIGLADARRYVRRHGLRVADPSVFGLSAAGDDAADADALRTRFREALLAGDEAYVRETVLRLVLGGRGVAAVCDDPVAAAYAGIRAGCEHPSERCVVLHAALHAAKEALADLRDLLEPPAADAPALVLADVGYEVDGLPVHLAAAVARDRGLRTVQLGGGVDPAVLAGAVGRCDAAWVWLSAGGGPQADGGAVARAAYAAADAAERCGARLVLHGDALPADARGERVDSMTGWDGLLCD